MTTYQVIVSNVGTVYEGDSKADAKAVYADYVNQSRQAIGRAAGEDVTAMLNGEPYREYVGAIAEARARADSSDDDTEDKEPCACISCRLSRALGIEASPGRRYNITVEDRSAVDDIAGGIAYMLHNSDVLKPKHDEETIKARAAEFIKSMLA